VPARGHLSVLADPGTVVMASGDCSQSVCILLVSQNKVVGVMAIFRQPPRRAGLPGSGCWCNGDVYASHPAEREQLAARIDPLGAARSVD